MDPSLAKRDGAVLVTFNRQNITQLLVQQHEPLFQVVLLFPATTKQDTIIQVITWKWFSAAN